VVPGADPALAKAGVGGYILTGPFFIAMLNYQRVIPTSVMEAKNPLPQLFLPVFEDVAAPGARS